MTATRLLVGLFSAIAVSDAVAAENRTINVLWYFNGILKHREAIAAALGSRTVITGSDADLRAIAGDKGNAPPKDGYVVGCNPPLTEANCWDGAVGHLMNAVNWAASGRTNTAVAIASERK